MKNILVVFGTRPEVIKLAPLITCLKENHAFHVTVCNTGQQKELSEQALSFFGLSEDINLNVMRDNQSLEAVQARLLIALKEHVSSVKYDGIFVQGDTISAFVGALVGYFNKIPIFHVEAGLRSGSLSEPMPEEGLRQMISRIASMHFCPTKIAQKNLHEEGTYHEVHVTGNTVIDAFNFITKEFQQKAQNEVNNMLANFERVVLVTCHRRENHGERLIAIVEAIAALASIYPKTLFLIPVHPNPNVRNIVIRYLGKIDNVLLSEPLNYPTLIEIQKQACLILTDSGGIQEEAPSFGTPILVLRHTTERPEGVSEGCAKLVGTDRLKIINEARNILDCEETKHNLTNPYGDGLASKRIVRHITNFFNQMYMTKEVCNNKRPKGKVVCVLRQTSL